MFFFGKNLKLKHKVTLCLVLLGILANGFLWFNLPQVPFVEYIPEQYLFFYDWPVLINYNFPQIVLAFGIFVKMLMIIIFRKF